MSIEVADVKLESHKDEIEKELLNNIPLALDECGLAAERFAKIYITEKGAIDTGLLRNSITHALSGQPAAISSYTDDNEEQSGEYIGTAPEASEQEMCVYIGTNVEYGPYVENGTKKMKERPFIKPAVANHGKEYQSIIDRWLGKET